MITRPRPIVFAPLAMPLICARCKQDTSFDDLYVDADGQQWDICKRCGEMVLGSSVAPVT